MNQEMKELIARALSDADAAFGLYRRYAEGDGVEQDKGKALFYLDVAVNNGNVEALMEKGKIYDRGLLSKKKEPWKAFQYYEKAGMNGNADGALWVAGYYDKMCHRERAMTWYGLAAKLGNAEAQRIYGVALFVNRYDMDIEEAVKIGVDLEDRNSLEWLKRSADQGDAPAQLHLGIAIAFRDSQEYGDSVEWMVKSAGNGNPEAMFFLGGCAFAAGGLCGVEHDEEAAMKWLRMAADAGLTCAEQRLGMYLSMADDEESRKEAAELTKKAAKKKYANAMIQLARFYEEGIGVRKNKATAIEWYEKAIDVVLAGIGNDDDERIAGLTIYEVPMDHKDAIIERATNSLRRLGADTPDFIVKDELPLGAYIPICFDILARYVRRGIKWTVIPVWVRTETGSETFYIWRDELRMDCFFDFVCYCYYFTKLGELLESEDDAEFIENWKDIAKEALILLNRDMDDWMFWRHNEGLHRIIARCYERIGDERHRNRHLRDAELEWEEPIFEFPEGKISVDEAYRLAEKGDVGMMDALADIYSAYAEKLAKAWSERAEAKGK